MVLTSPPPSPDVGTTTPCHEDAGIPIVTILALTLALTLALILAIALTLTVL